MRHWPSAQEIEESKSPKGAWTRETLSRWGVPWPPPKGWRTALIGRDEDFFRCGGRKPERREASRNPSGWLVTCAHCGHRAEIHQPLEVMQRAKLRCSNCGEYRAPAQATTALPWEDAEHAQA